MQAQRGDKTLSNSVVESWSFSCTNYNPGGMCAFPPAVETIWPRLYMLLVIEARCPLAHNTVSSCAGTKLVSIALRVNFDKNRQGNPIRGLPCMSLEKFDQVKFFLVIMCMVKFSNPGSSFPLGITRTTMEVKKMILLQEEVPAHGKIISYTPILKNTKWFGISC